MRPDRDELIRLLNITDPEEINALYRRAYEIKKENIGTNVYYRGLIELSNICAKDCYYCGIRAGNDKVERYLIDKEEVLAEAKWCWEQGYGSIVIQSGEREDRWYTDFITELVSSIKELSNSELGITLSLGEQSEEVYQRWFDAGAHRYLLRIETSNPVLYKTLHPADHSFEHRVNCLRVLKKVGYQVGTGVMIGLPGQTVEDLADDILFFYDEDIDMLGMGPFIPHHDTPLGHLSEQYDQDKALQNALKMIAVCRIALKDVNIASTTALQALMPTGRELGLLAGANIIMPNLTDTKYREGYQLYDGKPCMDENATQCRCCLENRIHSIGETVGYNQWGDSKHFIRNK
ncbi:MAG: [FeFe] hydrogenase H-cluster radical SAM maturase HydE [Candidatus Cloacimonadaceae bacterium]|nr:[FeFe] hydrogenase H-cluster radical SAM maturase HydE [Candidatus Cloacimonadaceae bacterium]MDP3114877.1 [FeFe] hydrogenase H-cluster radical SAM maturase HydE [Candidatus Cloacimonadaceae bacterium]